MIKVLCGVNPKDKIPVICDTIKDFHEFDKKFQEKDVPKMKDNPFMRVYIKEIDAELVFFKEYEDESSGSWGCRKGCVDNGVVPLNWKPLEQYKKVNMAIS